MKKEYAKPLVTVITLVADRPIANNSLAGWNENLSDMLVIPDTELDG